MSAEPPVADAPKPDEAARIDPTFRNGTITAFGITASFSLGFLSQWASSPGVWRLYDVLPALMICVGAGLQIRALALLLPVAGLERKIYDKATRNYLRGLILTGLGVFSAVSFDIVGAVLK